MKIAEVISLLGTMFDRLYEVDSEACVCLIKPHVIEGQAFLAELQEAIDKLDPTDIVKTDCNFGSDFNTFPVEGANGKLYFQRSLDKYFYGISFFPDDSDATTTAVFLKDGGASGMALCGDSKEYKEAMTLYEIADKLSMFKPVIWTKGDD